MIFPTSVILYRKIQDPDNPNRYLKNDYGKFILEEEEIKVALDLRENITRTREGAEVKTFMDVDFPASIRFDYGDELEYKDDFDRIFRGVILSLEENKDPLGIRTISRFASIGYQ